MNSIRHRNMNPTLNTNLNFVQASMSGGHPASSSHPPHPLTSPKPAPMVSIFIFIWIYICIHICIHICIYTYICICIYMYFQVPLVPQPASTPRGRQPSLTSQMAARALNTSQYRSVFCYLYELALNTSQYRSVFVF